MASARTDTSQLIINPLSTLTQVVFDNIEEDHYYYVREREPGEVPYDLYGIVVSKSGDRVRIRYVARRGMNPDGVGEGLWEDMGEDHDDEYVASRDLVNSWEQDMSARFYLPLEVHTDVSGGAAPVGAASAPVGGSGAAAP